MSKISCPHKILQLVGQTNTPHGAMDLYECQNPLCQEEFVLEPLADAQKF